MSNSPRDRDRHGRGVRHSLSGGLYKTGGTGFDSFASIVNATCEYLKERWPNELGNLKHQVVDAPIIGPNSQFVRRWAVRPESNMIIIYRLPILRLSHKETVNATEERIRIEHHIFEAAAELIGKEPWELIFGDGN